MNKDDITLNMPMKSSFQQKLCNAMNLIYHIFPLGYLKKKDQEIEQKLFVNSAHEVGGLVKLVSSAEL